MSDTNVSGYAGCLVSVLVSVVALAMAYGLFLIKQEILLRTDGEGVMIEASVENMVSEPPVCQSTTAVQTRPSFTNIVVPFERIEWPPEDGDTFEINWLDENGHLDDVETVRFLGADTPEIGHPEMCWFEAQPYSGEATDFTAAALEEADTIEIVRLECADPYGRTLAYVFVDGVNLSAELVWAGLAHANVDKYGYQGAIDEAREVEFADRFVDPRGSENPHDFRARMREAAKTDPRCQE
jgi:hypothetical protein